MAETSKHGEFRIKSALYSNKDGSRVNSGRCCQCLDDIEIFGSRLRSLFLSFRVRLALPWLGLDHCRVLDYLKILVPYLRLRPLGLLGFPLLFSRLRRLGFVLVVQNQLNPPVLLVLAEDKVDVFVQLPGCDHLRRLLLLLLLFLLLFLFLGSLLEVPLPLPFTSLLLPLPLRLPLRLPLCLGFDGVAPA